MTTSKPSAVASEGLIDFRVRPPYGAFRQAFPHANVPEKSDEELLDTFLDQMDAAGVDRAVVAARNLPGELDPSGIFKGKVPNSDLLAMRKRSDRFELIGAVDLLAPGLEHEVRALADQGFIGLAFEAPLYRPALHHDDEALDRAYALCQELNLIAMVTASGMIGPDLSFSDPTHIQRVAKRFPDLDIVVTHAAWPWTTQMAAVLFEEGFNAEQNVFVLPDGYLHNELMPGREHYVAAAAMFPGSFLYGSSFPNRSLAVGADGIRGLEVTGVDDFAAQTAANAQALIGRHR